MKKWLVDVPVKMNIWIREECQRKQFNVIKAARPSILFIISDGGRNEDEWTAIKNNRKLIDEGIDWECMVYRLYEDKNNGLYTMAAKTKDFVWSRVDRCVSLEDDILPSVSFFQYCADLLEYYKDDLRIESICGMNHLGVSEDVTSDYFFSRQGSIWGTATWKRSIEARGDFSYANDEYVLKLLKQRTKHNKTCWGRVVGYSKNNYYEGHVPAAEFYHEFAMYSQNQLQIIPKVNLISNMGCTAVSAHEDTLEKTPRGMRRIYNMKTYEIDFPLKHPHYVIPDVEYEKKRNRIMAYNHPIVAFYRRVERVVLTAKAGDFTTLSKKIKKRFVRGEKIEK